MKTMSGPVNCQFKGCQSKNVQLSWTSKMGMSHYEFGPVKCDGCLDKIVELSLTSKVKMYYYESGPVNFQFQGCKDAVISCTAKSLDPN